MRRFIILIFISCIVMSASAHGLKWRFSTDQITFEQWSAYFDELASTKKAVLTEESEYYIINLFDDPDQPAIYVFTKQNHPAYPAVVIRAVESSKGESKIVRHGHYAGDKDKFDAWWHEFDALDKKNIEDAK